MWVPDNVKEDSLAIRNGCNFKFTKPIARDMFLTSKQYDCFMHRLNQLNSESLAYRKCAIYDFSV